MLTKLQQKDLEERLIELIPELIQDYCFGLSLPEIIVWIIILITTIVACRKA
ncbi:MAG: hypothetical protein Q8T09_11255 [Candidatus Melainabacteria bacterium]|nr:hypothetical protein [Candidatus Melainabacteria bacterium]